jgi:hypothetical protein
MYLFITGSKTDEVLSSKILMDTSSSAPETPRALRWATIGVLVHVLLWLAGSADMAFADNTIYQPVPGLAPSDQYALCVCAETNGSNWQSLFAWETVSKPDWTNDAYFPILSNWTHTYVNFEMDTPVIVEISRVNGVFITNAAVHPAGNANSCAITNGKIYVTLNNPCNVAVDIDNQMDGQDTGYVKAIGADYSGPPIHTVSIHANPPLVGKPSTNDPTVYLVAPGVTPPSTGAWSTLYFLPGIHTNGLAFPVHANKNYYIPGDALVYGTFYNSNWSDGHNIRIFGYGTLSGALWQNPKYVPGLNTNLYDEYHPINIDGAYNTSVEGITIIDPPYHSVMLYGAYEATNFTLSSWVKVFGWRANGDGINPFANGQISNCFLRTQDDSCYVNGVGIRDTVYWNDANGSSFVFSALPNLTNRTLLVHDCDVIYSRAAWIDWSGGRVFNMRGLGGGACGAGVIFSNINISDPRPTMQQFFLCMTVPPPYSTVTNARTPGNMAGVIFKNVTIAATNSNSEPEILWGESGAGIQDVTFDNLRICGLAILANIFQTNDCVSNLLFTNSTPTVLTGFGAHGGQFSFSLTNSGSYVGLGGANGSSVFSITNNASYVVQASANLPDPNSWVPIYANTAPFTFTDTNALNLYQRRFYRVMIP